MTKPSPINRQLLVKGGGARRRSAVVVNQIASFRDFECQSNGATVKEPTSLASRRRKPIDVTQPDDRLAMDSPPLAIAIQLLETDMRIERRESQLSPVVEELKEMDSADTEDLEEPDNEDNYSLSYEECLEISEALGSVKEDKWALCAEEEINRLPVIIHKRESGGKHKADIASCLVCLQQYETNDVLRYLPCNHAFHICCADQWLLQTNACPCCRKPIDTTCSL